MKLITLTLPVEKPPELRLQRTIDLRNPVNDVLGWTILVRGPAVILIPPAPPKDRPGDFIGAFEIARVACTLRWDSPIPADYDKMVNFTSEPLARPKPPGDHDYSAAVTSTVVTREDGKAVAK
jgi:hypothetical protein